MNVQQTLYAMGFRREPNGGGTEIMVWRGATHTWVASGLDGDMPEDDWWLICEYTTPNWEEGMEDERAYSSECDSLADVIADMGGF